MIIAQQRGVGERRQGGPALRFIMSNIARNENLSLSLYLSSNFSEISPEPKPSHPLFDPLGGWSRIKRLNFSDMFPVQQRDNYELSEGNYISVCFEGNFSMAKNAVVTVG